MPLGAIVARRLCRALTIGNPASRRSHSKPLGVSGNTGTPCSAKRVLESILRAVVASPLVSAHTDRADTGTGADIGLGLGLGLGLRCHQVGRCSQMGRSHFDTQVF